MLALVDEAEAILTDKDRNLDDFGRLLDHTWKLKKQTGGSISTNSINEFYQKGIEAGALGGKLLGVVAVVSLYFMFSRNTERK